MSEEEVLQCFTALLVFDEKEEEEEEEDEEGGESEPHPEHAVDTSDGIYKIKTRNNTFNFTLKNNKSITH